MNITLLPVVPRTLLLLFIMLWANTVFADTPEPPPEPTNYSAGQDISKDSLQAKIDAMATRKGLDEALKSRLIAIYQSEQVDLSNTQSFN